MRLLAVLLAMQLTRATLLVDPSAIQYTVSSWTENDGLPANAVRALAQDRDGYLWLGTRAGLVRFDGVRFTVWQDDSQDELPESDVTAVHVGRDGSLWIGYGGSGGIARMKDGRVDVYKPGDGLAVGFVQALLEDRSGVIWAGGLGGLSRFDGDRWEAVGAQLGLSSDTIFNLHQDRQDNLWIASSGGAFLRRPGARAFSRISDPARIEAVAGLSEDASGAMWMADARGAIERLGNGQAQTSQAPSMQGHNSRVLHDSQGNLWVGLRGSGVLLVPHGRAIDDELGVRRFTIQDGLAGNNASGLLEDREGNVWVATDGGLSRLSPSMVWSLSDIGTENPGIAVTRDGSVWIASERRIVRMSGHRRTWYTQQQGLPGTEITALHTDRRGKLWAAARSGLARFDKGAFSWLPLAGDSAPRAIQAMADHPQGGLWLLATNGERYRWSDGHVAPSPSSPELASKVTLALYTDPDGSVWEGFTDGSLAVHRADGTQVYSAQDGIAPGSVRVIARDASGTVWVGTSTGLSRFRDGRFTSVPLRRILPGTMVIGIVQDDSGYLWLGMTSGILRLHPAEFERALDPAHQIQYTFYSASDGLRGFPARRPYPTAVRGGDGMLRFVTSSGVSVIDPRRAVEPRPIGVRIEGVVVDGQASPPVPQMPPRTQRIEIAYRALSLTDADKIHFRYMLEGFDAGWVNAGPARQALYANLQPGSYRFQVTAGKEDGVWSDPAAVWEFSIQPTFYQTYWFYATSALGATLVLFAAWQVRQRQLRRQFALVIEERARMAREIHDTVLQSLVGLTLQLDAVSSQSESTPHAVRQQLIRMRRQVSRYIRETRQSIWDLRTPVLETRDVAAALREAGENLTTGSDVRFEHVIQGEPIRLPARVDEQLLRIGQEAISNVVRHAHATVVRLELAFERAAVRLRVVDDGCGMERSSATEEHEHHLGLKSMEERAFRIGARIHILSRPGAGTTVDVTVPLPARRDGRTR